MGGTKNFPPCFQIVAAFSRHDAALQWLWKQVQESFGSIAAQAPSLHSPSPNIIDQPWAWV